MAKTPRTWTGARTPSGLKRVRQAQRRRELLQPRRSAAKTYVAKALTAAAAPADPTIDPNAALAEALSALDRAAKAGAIHPNAAARRKSRLTRKVNAALGGDAVQTGGRVAKTTGKAAAAKAAKARIAAGKAGKAKGAQTAAGKARAALSKTARAEAAAAKAAAEAAPPPRRRRPRPTATKTPRPRPRPRRGPPKATDEGGTKKTARREGRAQGDREGDRRPRRPPPKAARRRRRRPTTARVDPGARPRDDDAPGQPTGAVRIHGRQRRRPRGGRRRLAASSSVPSGLADRSAGRRLDDAGFGRNTPYRAAPTRPPTRQHDHVPRPELLAPVEAGERVDVRHAGCVERRPAAVVEVALVHAVRAGPAGEIDPPEAGVADSRCPRRRTAP